jgi:hypothetical protein
MGYADKSANDFFITLFPRCEAYWIGNPRSWPPEKLGFFIGPAYPYFRFSARDCSVV